MATYLILNSLFLSALLLALVAAGRFTKRNWRWLCLVLLVLLILTFVFDNIIIAAGIVGYDTSKISGLYVGLAPIEDFAYAIAAALLVPLLWWLTSNKSRKADK